MRKAILVVLLATAAAFGQSSQISDSKLISVSGTAWTHQNSYGEQSATIEYMISGSPTSVSIVLQGCMRGGTCTTLDTYAFTTSTTRTIAGLYDSYVITPTFSGGSSPTVQINWLGSQRPLAVGTLPLLDPCASPNTTKVSIAVNVTANALLSALSAGKKIYVCSFGFTLSGTTPTAQFETGTGAVCATGTTALTGAFIPTSGAYVSSGSGNTLFVGNSGGQLCLFVTGTTPSVQGWVTVVQQ